MAESFKNMFDKPFFGRFVNDLSLVLQNRMAEDIVNQVNEDRGNNFLLSDSRRS